MKMENKKVYSVTGLFDTPDAIIRAVRLTTDAGYKKYDVNTPYPVHGMDRVMQLKPSMLSYIALAFGLGGLFSALIFMYYVADINYPLVIGGKPHGSFPAFVPILFEVTVLVASIMTVVSMLFIFFKLPNNSHPLHDTPYMKSVSTDKFGLSIQAADNNFEEGKVREFLASAGASDIQTIYFEPEEFDVWHNVFEMRFLIFLLVIAVSASLITYISLNYILAMEPFNWMVHQQKVVPQDESRFFSDRIAMRQPVKGSVARGFMPYEFAGRQADAALRLVNPMKADKAVLKTGKEHFNTYCSPCHGYSGRGDSRLRGQFPNPPSLLSKKMTEWKDGDIYHVITNGQNIMPSYASQIQRTDRWAIVLYIRQLQKSNNSSENK